MSYLKNKPHTSILQRFFSCSIFFFSLSLGLEAQSVVANWSIGGNICYGTFLKHSKKQDFEINAPAKGVSIDFMHQSSGKEVWAKLHGRPRAGIGLIYVDYGAPDLLGKAIGLYPQIDIWLIRTPKITLYTRLAFGVSYLTKAYDRVTNVHHTAIGSHINNYTTAGLAAEYRISNRLAIRLGGHFSHSSNGRLRTPNLGINTALINAGVNYRFSPESPPDTFRLPQGYQYSRKPLFGVRGSLGIKEASVPNGPFYYVWMLTPHIIFPKNEKHQWETGMEITFDGEVRNAYLNGEDYNIKYTIVKPLHVSVYGGHEFLFGRIGFITQLHLHVFPFLERKNEFYSLIGGKVYLKSFHKYPRNQLYTGIFLKAHYAVAQYPSVILGTTF